MPQKSAQEIQQLMEQKERLQNSLASTKQTTTVNLKVYQKDNERI